ncbi:tetratricopeptide repeat protein [Gilvimarinus agarilyticus]|uniref:tetratricopeptide repeat protein n=1 Tax=Gilvimarinus sp. 2_MG-2023 TaxID=3062666 RepID=UPI001C093AED|nr:tetratricopeptide repeat protein [Gilvimarinus sp. 2_MG-2023]MBU2886092.1 tetratricopeptide repeat protein [Gilvimarinus agarilyticus]MDO6570801.1 tetratricopeptide repeat protein [Gilvimarinus sp. 2_MG-2023]
MKELKQGFAARCYGGWIISAVLLASCASHTPAPVSEAGGGQTLDPSVSQPSPDATEPQQPAESGEPSAPAPVQPSMGNRDSAVAALLERSLSEYRRGRYPQSVATAERALRIDRRNADIYLLLAKNYYRLEDNQQAAQFAQRGLRYCGDDRSLKWELERILNKTLD